MSKKEKENKEKIVNFGVRMSKLHHQKMSELAHERYKSMQQLFNDMIVDTLKSNKKL